MYHPNVKKDTGEICLDVFANSWSPTQKVSDIIEKLASLLVSPSTESPLEAEIAQEFVSDHKKWEKKVKEFVKKNKGKLLEVKEIPTYKMLYKNFLKRYEEAIQQLNNDNEYLTEEELYNLLYTIGMISHPNKTANEETNE